MSEDGPQAPIELVYADNRDRRHTIALKDAARLDFGSAKPFKAVDAAAVLERNSAATPGANTQRVSRGSTAGLSVSRSLGS